MHEADDTPERAQDNLRGVRSCPGLRTQHEAELLMPIKIDGVNHHCGVCHFKTTPI